MYEVYGIKKLDERKWGPFFNEMRKYYKTVYKLRVLEKCVSPSMYLYFYQCLHSKEKQNELDRWYNECVKVNTFLAYEKNVVDNEEGIEKMKQKILKQIRKCSG